MGFPLIFQLSFPQNTVALLYIHTRCTHNYETLNFYTSRVRVPAG
jgi:hypothetical protein